MAFGILLALTASVLWNRPICKEPGRYIGWPSVICTKGGELLAVFSGDRDSHVCPWGKVQLVRSKDGGETWSAPISIRNDSLDDRDAGIMELANGDLVVTYFSSLHFGKMPVPMYKLHSDKLPLREKITQHGHFTMRSTDGGKTWEDPVPTVGSAPHGGIQLRDGRLMMVGREWKEMSGMPDEDPRKTRLKDALPVEVSSDGGRAWKVLTQIVPTGNILSNFCEPTLAEPKKGRIVAQFRVENRKQFIWQAESSDGGHTWTPTHQLPLVGLPPHLLVLKDGGLLSTYACRLPERLGVWACLSKDGGRTWNLANEVKLCSAEDSDMGYATTAELPDGRLVTVYYGRDKVKEGCCLMGVKWKLDGR